ncbi:hypothetical protein GCM10010112_23300 [Actinoplanes lobatus]|uniref:Hemophore-related protein n=1 Tax=Actinoplanes lobatus TaxID=113568 RepID=A0A7W7HJL2_9ACTN|nr:hypothetical protein [Actinoplanes lobatus]MBB4751372.1 hypothetical protein [Actinoplanes lobatus]GGN63759.1 hypothetical protein GCM10010112_23300 [Actinoplanes lobatus]GIE40982.1 hypothetical protein Alo02nite_38800 [Actinoplanes lobatus]
MTSHRRLAVSLALIISIAVLSGCAPADTEPPSTDAPMSGGDGATRAGGSYSATDVCTYLQGEIPALKEIGSPVGRHANLAGKLTTFFESHGKPENGAALDAAIKAECPAVRTEVLRLMGVDSFSSF